VQANLGDKGLLIDYTFFKTFDFSKLRWNDELHAGAVAISRNEVIFRDLGPAAEIKNSITDYLAQLGSDDKGFSASLKLYSELLSPFQT